MFLLPVFLAGCVPIARHIENYDNTDWQSRLWVLYFLLSLGVASRFKLTTFDTVAPPKDLLAMLVQTKKGLILP